MPLQPGQVINQRYRIVRILGQGGFGAVYYAWDLNLERVVAIKENLYATEEAQRQFRQEALFLSGLSHAHLPRVLDYFILPEEGQYLVMEYVEGQDLEQMLEQARGPLPFTQVIPWISQICDALTYLHTRTPAIIHRDIKPANIRITTTGQAMLVDFGIAKTFDPARHTTTGARAYTTGYSPPEQYGRGRTDVQSDIFSLGATLFTLLTGMVPPDSVDRLTDRQLQNLPAAHQYNPQVSPQVSWAITVATQLEKAARFATAADFKAALLHPSPSTQPVVQVAPARPAPQPTAWAPAGPSIPAPAPSRFVALGGTLGIAAIAVAAVLVVIIVLSRLSDGSSGNSTSGALPTIPIGLPATAVSQVEPSEIQITPPDSRITPIIHIPTELPPVLTEVILQPSEPLPAPTTQAPLPTGEPVSSRPGGTIAFHSNRSGNLEIYTIRADGTGLTQITHSDARETYPSWSPDGRRLAYQTNAGGDMEIHIRDLDSGNAWAVTDNRCNDFAPTFSPRGDLLAFYSDCAGDRQIFTVQVDGKHPRQLTGVTHAYSWYPFWGADGWTLFFSSNQSGKYWLYSMDREGDQVTRLVQGCSGVPSPDGARLVYQEFCLEQSSLLIADTTGGHLEQIVSGDQYDNRDPYWSPDSNWIVFRSNRNGDFDLFLYNVLTGAIEPLTAGAGDDHAPSWSPVER